MRGFLGEEGGDVLGAPGEFGFPGGGDFEEGVFEGFADLIGGDEGVVEDEFDLRLGGDGGSADGESGGS